MHWDDIALIVGTTRFAESSFIVTVLTRNHGLHKGLLKWTIVPVSDLVNASWTARLQDHLGVWSFNPICSYVQFVINNKAKLSVVIVLCELLRTMLTERTPCTAIFDRTIDFFEKLKSENLDWINHYLLLEAFILEKNGFGFDFSEVKDLKELFYFVSPNTGKVVSQAKGELYKNKLLICPAFMASTQYTQAKLSLSDINSAFTLLNYFLRKALPDNSEALHKERARLVERVQDLLQNDRQ
jgi:DNA repair protein RecO (recombination protein O)